MATDARVRYTKMMIQAKFLLLLEKKPINKITVKEICELAEINRATFYKYYMDAYDLLDKIKEEILSELENTIQSSLNDGVNNTLIKMLEKMKENGNIYITLFSENGDSSFSTKVFRICYGEFAAYIAKQYPKLTMVQHAWIYVYTAQGSSGILNYWINDGMTESPKQVAQFIDQLISNTLQGLT